MSEMLDNPEIRELLISNGIDRVQCFGRPDSNPFGPPREDPDGHSPEFIVLKYWDGRFLVMLGEGDRDYPGRVACHLFDGWDEARQFMRLPAASTTEGGTE